jgi:ketosteroid isomerase-like protein
MNGEQEIRQLVDAKHQAICRKDIGEIMRHYADDAVLFNVKPPYQIKNRKEWQAVWEAALAHFPASFGLETRDLRIMISDALATVHYLMRFTELPGSQSWVRTTVVYRKNHGASQIVHEHSSIPFDPETSKVVFESE